MKRYILGIDAAWTEKEPTGMALLSMDDLNTIELVKASRSYDEFFSSKIEWSTPVTGTTPDLNRVINYCKDSGWDICLVALDIPLSHTNIIARRECDNQVSRYYGKFGASTHSPSEDRPGVISKAIFRQLSECGYIWNGDSNCNKSFIEVYPHTAIIEFFHYDYRFPYKVQKRTKYWPNISSEQQVRNIKINLNELREKITQSIPNTSLIIPKLSIENNHSIKYLKSYEDTLDALICGMTGCFHLLDATIGFGNEDGIIWVPKIR